MSKLIARTVSYLHNEEDVVEIKSLEGDIPSPSLYRHSILINRKDLVNGSFTVFISLVTSSSEEINTDTKLKALISVDEKVICNGLCTPATAGHNVYTPICVTKKSGDTLQLEIAELMSDITKWDFNGNESYSDTVTQII